MVARPRTRTWRYVVPLVLVAGLGLGNSVRGRLSDRAAPTLPERTAAEVAEWAAGPHPQPRSGFLELSTNLGVGDFGSVSSDTGGSLVALASGTSRARLWSDGESRRRIAVIQPLQETDWFRNGDVTWVWHSSDSRVTKVATPSAPANARGLISLLAGGGAVESPDGLAARLLALRDQSTRLVLHTPTYVADRPVYQLGLVPQTPTSLVTEVTIAVDAATGLPLRVSVNTRSGVVAIDSRFTSLTFTRPSESNFSFRAPPEARVTEGATARTAPVTPGDWRSEHHREEALADVQSVRGIDDALLQYATAGQGWNEVVAASGFNGWRLERLSRAGDPVTGPYGSGRLVRTPVFSLLILDGGRIVAGAVTPAGLEPAAIQLGATR